MRNVIIKPVERFRSWWKILLHKLKLLWQINKFITLQLNERTVVKIEIVTLSWRFTNNNFPIFGIILCQQNRYKQYQCNVLNRLIWKFKTKLCTPIFISNFSVRKTAINYRYFHQRICTVYSIIFWYCEIR